MPRNYTTVEHLSTEIFRRKSAGETNCQIAESYHLTMILSCQIGTDMTQPEEAVEK